MRNICQQEKTVTLVSEKLTFFFDTYISILSE